MEGGGHEQIRAVLDDVIASMREAFAAVGCSPPERLALNQLHLRDGDQVVNDYLNHGEEGLAIDHLLYMIEEPPLRLSPAAFEQLASAAAAVGIDSSRLEEVRPV